LLKPGDFLPEKASGIIQKYTEDIFTTITQIRDNYLQKL
jgi:hypothetical protein